ncbi:hypothetical protein KP509_35G049900 [Ceratopteris richardii]|nr:hypothetical protein KP509_35G049900 [Ceratopteris richardii]
MLQSSVCSSFISPFPKNSVLQLPASVSPSISITASGSSSSSSSTGNDVPLVVSRRSLTSLSGAAGIIYLLASTPRALADIEDEYKEDTQSVIVLVRNTLGLEKTDPSRGEAVKALRQSSNKWVAKYRREKRFAGKPSYSNMYSVLNAVSGHYISYGDGAPLPPKRRNQILDEVDIAERALARGR